MTFQRLNGLIAATYTPFDRRGNLNPDQYQLIVDYLLDRGVNGLYVCGSTGEGMSLTVGERIAVTNGYVRAADGRVPVIVQVGHNCVEDARQLAAAAADSGADAISATCPSYYKIADTDLLIACMKEIAGGAPDLPFYYYHIPSLTGSTISMPDFLDQAGTAIPNLVGLKYTDTKLFEFQECRHVQNGRFDVVWGCDEMLLGALATGAEAAIGSTYNIAAPLYQKLIQAFNAGNLSEARQLQLHSVQMIRLLAKHPFHSAMKALLGSVGVDVGTCRLPQGGLSDQDVTMLCSELEAIGFFDWSGSIVQ